MAMAHYWQEQFPLFTFVKYQQEWEQQNLRLTFFYQLGEQWKFRHCLIFPDIKNPHSLNRDLLTQLIFHLGIIEGFSYWKLAASPHWHITAGRLDDTQISFWQKLLTHGMGEYFYQNKLNPEQPPLAQFTSNGKTVWTPPTLSPPSNRLGIGIGGGKDSAVMLEILKNQSPLINLIVEPCSPAAKKMASESGLPTIIIKRQLDPQLKVLNARGMLNGHVPFSASLAFIFLIASQLYELSAVFSGNEASSSEATTKYLSIPVNHQYSKSGEFESDFRHYCEQFLFTPCPYYSLLRPLNELQIAKIFARLPHQFSLFRSCNRGQQQHLWCERCPKCLFVYLILAPFIEEKILTTAIFQHNLLDQKENYSHLVSLLGLTDSKPFECVGSVAESQVAFYLTYQKYQRANHRVPLLINQLAKKILPLHDDWETFCSQIINNYGQHNLPTWAEELVKKTQK